MNENTVFQNTTGEGDENPIPQPPQGQVQVAPQQVGENLGPPPLPSGIFSLGNILKIVLGIVVLAIIGFVIFQFVLPIFSQNKNEKVTLTYWGLWEEPSVFQSIISDFERENPNIKIEYSKMDKKQYRERLAARIDNNTGPDIFRFHNTWLPEISKYLSPLSSDAITQDEFKKNFYPVTQTDLIQNGAIYGIPLEIDSLSLFVNTQIFKDAGVQIPTSWDDFIKTSKALTVKGENGKIKTAGAALGTYDNIDHAPDIISLLFLQNGVDLYDISATSKKAVDSLDFYTSFAKGEGSVWDSTLDSSMLAFANGSLAMYFGYSWDVFMIQALNKDLPFQVVPVPYLTDRKMTIASYWVEGVSVKSKHQKEAMLFMKFLSRKETEQKLYSEESKTRLFGEPYARVDLMDSLKDNKIVYPFVSQAPNARSSFFASDTEDNGLNQQMNVYLGDAVRSILGNTSPETAVETLSQGVTQVLQQYGE
ncbi:MAG: sugar ABC transporter substrate-binding protein [Patescibacteria group bacterium]|nr:sugar ABC transporter substrate-binding protein [Patescibacteria group bacterium]